jgi:tRNA(Ile2) C34 agmatinyltransferase TiaS
MTDSYYKRCPVCNSLMEGDGYSDDFECEQCGWPTMYQPIDSDDDDY